MEKTLKERAKSYCHIERTDSIDCLHAYIIGATEQKAIDIDKACEWLRNHLVAGNGTPEFINAFRKAMTDKTE